MFVCFQAEDGIRDLVRSRGLGDVYKRQPIATIPRAGFAICGPGSRRRSIPGKPSNCRHGTMVETSGSAASQSCLLYTSDAADERSSVDLGGRRTIKKNHPPPPPGRCSRAWSSAQGAQQQSIAGGCSQVCAGSVKEQEV